MYVAKYLSIYLYLQPGECIHVLLYSKINLFVNIFYCFEIWVKYKQEEKDKRKWKKILYDYALLTQMTSKMILMILIDFLINVLQEQLQLMVTVP